MNMDTVRKCVQIAANQQLNAFGAVGEDILELMAELDKLEQAEAALPALVKPAKSSKAAKA